MHLDRMGYVPGENILINAECDNKSDRVMCGSSVELKQVELKQVELKQV